MLFEILTSMSNGGTEDHVLINVKKQAISVSVNIFTIYTFDLKGRLVTAVREGHTFQRSLENQILEKWSTGRGAERKRIRRWLDKAAIKDLLDDIQTDISRLHFLIGEGKYRVLKALESDDVTPITDTLGRILHYDFRHLDQDARLFHRVYRPIGILPPDMYMALVLQATEGCSYNDCTFCHFYNEQSFRVKPPEEFVAHLKAVKNYFGEAIALRKSLFLGEANAFDLSQRKLLSFLDVVHEHFSFSNNGVPGVEDPMKPAFTGIYGFMSGLYDKRKTPDDIAELRARHVRRIYFGMESGNDELLSFLHKPASTDRLLRTVETIKKGGVNVGIIILLGAGGRRFYAQHVEDTVQAIREMSLEVGDIIYFSPLVALPGSVYSENMKTEGVEFLSEQELELQKQDMLEGFRLHKGMGSPRVATYDINEFIY